MAQKFWWTANQRHQTRFNLKLPIRRLNNSSPCASGHYWWSNMYFSNSVARRVPPWSWPKSYKSRSKSGDWVPTFDPLIPSNGEWPRNCVPVFVTLRDTSRLAGLHMRTLQPRVDRACECNADWMALREVATSYHFTNQKSHTKSILPYAAKKQLSFKHTCLLDGILISTYVIFETFVMAPINIHVLCIDSKYVYKSGDNQWQPWIYFIFMFFVRHCLLFHKNCATVRFICLCPKP